MLSKKLSFAQGYHLFWDKTRVPLVSLYVFLFRLSAIFIHISVLNLHRSLSFFHIPYFDHYTRSIGFIFGPGPLCVCLCECGAFILKYYFPVLYLVICMISIYVLVCCFLLTLNFLLISIT